MSERGRLRRILVPGPAVLAGLAAALPLARLHLSGYDALFNLAQGRWILAHGFPARDPFSVTAAGPWFPHEWGFSVLTALVEGRLGGVGPALLGAALVFAEVLLLWRALARARGGGDLAALVLFGLALAVQTSIWHEVRAFQAGNVCALVALLVVRRWRERPTALGLLWLVPLTALWANLHGSWIVGPLLLFSTAFGRALELRRLDRAGVLAVGAAGAAWLAAALSPAGPSNLWYPFLLAGRIHRFGITEWQAFSVRTGADVVFVLLAAGLVAAAIARRAVRWSSVVPAAGLAAAALGAYRHVPLAAALLAVALADHLPVLAGRLGEAAARVDAGARRWSRASGGAVWGAAVLVVLAVQAGRRPVPLARNLNARMLPVRALEALETLPPGRVLNRWRFGGAVSAVDGPGYKVFIDGRADLFPDAVHADYRRLQLLAPGWQDVLRRYDPDYFLWTRADHGAPLLEALRIAGGWTPVVEEPAGVLWRRVRP